jgi:hypothetical protein
MNKKNGLIKISKLLDITKECNLQIHSLKKINNKYMAIIFNIDDDEIFYILFILKWISNQNHDNILDFEKKVMQIPENVQLLLNSNSNELTKEKEILYLLELKYISHYYFSCGCCLYY